MDNKCCLARECIEFFRAFHTAGELEPILLETHRGVPELARIHRDDTDCELGVQSVSLFLIIRICVYLVEHTPLSRIHS